MPLVPNVCSEDCGDDDQEPLDCATDSISLCLPGVAAIIGPTGATGPAGAPGGAGAVQTKTTTYTALSTDMMVLADPTAGEFTITLPPVAAGRSLIVKYIAASSNIVTVIPASGTIDGFPSDSLNVQWQSKTYVSSATAWFRV